MGTFKNQGTKTRSSIENWARNMLSLPKKVKTNEKMFNFTHDKKNANYNFIETAFLEGSLAIFKLCMW